MTVSTRGLPGGHGVPGGAVRPDWPDTGVPLAAGGPVVAVVAVVRVPGVRTEASLA